MQKGVAARLYGAPSLLANGPLQRAQLFSVCPIFSKFTRSDSVGDAGRMGRAAENSKVLSSACFADKTTNREIVNRCFRELRPFAFARRVRTEGRS